MKKADVATVKRAITIAYGRRCKLYGAYCPCCIAWAAFDRVCDTPIVGTEKWPLEDYTPVNGARAN